MRLFVGSHRAKLDKKGRVSFPADFRTALEGIDSQNVYLRRHHMHTCIEGLSQPKLDSIAARLDNLDDYSEEADDLRMTLFADSKPINYDAEGRFSMPPGFAEYAGLGETIVFAGMGDVFRILPESFFEQRLDEARRRARDKGLNLPRTPRPPA